MEVASRGSGGKPMKQRSESHQSAEGDRVRLNMGLYAATVVCVCVAVFLAVVLLRQEPDTVGGVKIAPDVGEDVGRGVVEAVPLADDSDQKRVAAQIEAASEMVDAFVNFDYKDADKTIAAVQSMSTGTFLEQYNKGAADLKKLATRAKSTMVARVLWTGLVAGDKDSATLIAATSGTVTNKVTKFKKESRNYRIQVDLTLDKGRWLTKDLQYVELG